jgi:hypothetical protein
MNVGKSGPEVGPGERARILHVLAARNAAGATWLPVERRRTALRHHLICGQRNSCAWTERAAVHPRPSPKRRNRDMITTPQQSREAGTGQIRCGSRRVWCHSVRRRLGGCR